MTLTVRPNATNLRAVLAQIEAHPETWYQRMWHCDTSHCFFGWGQLFAGRMKDHETALRDGRVFFGLDHEEAEALSEPFNSIEDIRAMVARFTAPDYVRLDTAEYDADGYDADGLDCNNEERK